MGLILSIDVGARSSITLKRANSERCEFGVGAFNVEAGCVVANVNALLGEKAGSDGTATVKDVGSQCNSSGTLTVGDVGHGFLKIDDGDRATNVDDVTMDAANLTMEVAEDSIVVFFGSYNGGSTGLGKIQAFGDLRPGNSPAIAIFGGDLEMGVNTSTFIELGGLTPGEFDQLLVAGNLDLNGELDVSLINGFQISSSMEFLFADVTGIQTGMFDGLNEGSVVGNFNGRDLFITCGAGDGNDIALFTAVPEPGSMSLIGCMMMGWFAQRRRRK